MQKAFLQAALSGLLLLAIPGCRTSEPEESETTPEKTERHFEWSVVIHGGAGDFANANYTQSEEEAYLFALQTALDTAVVNLETGQSAVDVAEKVVAMLEDCPLFNAGRGAVFTSDGTIELDASIMEGRTLKAGAVTGLRSIKNPIMAARAVMDSSRHVMLSGEGALTFAKSQGLQEVDNTYFRTQRSVEAYFKAKEKKAAEGKMGTVGCVVLDKNGDLAAASSTGGMMLKEYGRIGDSPIIGAGTYADNKTCAVSCTGHGEFFIRAAVAHEISACMEHGGMTLKEAAQYVVQNKLVEMGGAGGIIAVDGHGNSVMEFNTPGMFRGFARSDSTSGVFMYKTE